MDNAIIFQNETPKIDFQGENIYVAFEKENVTLDYHSAVIMSVTGAPLNHTHTTVYPEADDLAYFTSLLY